MKTVVAVMCAMIGMSMAGPSMTPYQVIWQSPSTDHTGQMPLGNGDIAAGVCAIQDDALYVLLSKNDAFNYNGDIFKTGRVKVSLEPNPFASGKPFKQTLDLETGSVLIHADDVRLRVWADAHRPVYHIQIDSSQAISVTAESDLWERMDGCAHNCTNYPIDNPAQDVLLERGGKILWYYTVGDRSVYPIDLKFYDVEHMADEYADPFRFNTFGNLLESPDLQLEDAALRGTGKTFDIRVHALTRKAPDISEWIKDIEALAAKPVHVNRDWQNHLAWWTNFWNRSWITVNDNTISESDRGQVDHEGYTKTRKAKDKGALVAQSYNVFRYAMACQSRGRIQTKFNGGILTQPLRSQEKPTKKAIQRADGMWISHEDDRRWARRFTFQNQRLLYWPLFMSGDTDLTRPFFDHYWNLLPMRKAITKAWFEHEGAYFRENIELTGAERDCQKRQNPKEAKPLKTPPGGNDGNGYYHSYYFTSGLETVAMMIEYVHYTGDETFRDEVLVPFAREILLFFDKHYTREPDGKLLLDPAMVLETWWIAVNPAPDIAGLLHCLDGLLQMNAGIEDDKAEWTRFRKEIPDVHLHQIDGRTAIAPARTWAKKANSENGLLYPVFPFRRFGIGMGSKDIVEWTMQHRTNKNRFGYKCWTQDQIHWAYAGNAAEAKHGLIQRFTNASDECRFPLYGSKKPDSCPDFDHFGSGSIALQRMLVQEAGDKILLLPAWPATWDTQFKLHLANNTVIKGHVQDGRLLGWDIEPKSRQKDVVVYEPQKDKAGD